MEDYAPPPVPSQYLIQSGDTLSVRVWNQEGMSAEARVREDGKISLPFLNDVVAAGYAPNVLSGQLQTRLKDFINNPVVTVALVTARPLSVSITGEVLKPGIYALEPAAGVLSALATAGGLTEYAHDEHIYVVRTTPKQRIRFTYEALARSVGKAPEFRLQLGDVIVVE